MKENRSDVGVIVGRFQLPELHRAHRALIEHVREQHDKVVVVLGLSPLFVTRQNPLDFEARKQMIAEAYPDVVVLYIKDVDSDALWSKRLDGLVADVIHPGQSAVLYGSRDSFLEHYTGKLPALELEQTSWVSGSEIRRRVARAKARSSVDFRAGVVWASYARFPTAFPTVDVAVTNGHDLLLVRKPSEPLFRLIGGFAEPESDGFEDDARREVREEAGVEVGEMEYVGSAKIDDWRYRSEVDKVKTLLFWTYWKSGMPDPQDDEIAEARWFPLGELRRRDLMPAHRPLLVMLRAFIASRSR